MAIRERPKAKAVATKLPPVAAATPQEMKTSVNVPINSANPFLTRLMISSSNEMKFHDLFILLLLHFKR
jgi:hypothetical protein